MTGNGARPPPAPGAEAATPGSGQASTLPPSSTTVDSSTEGAPPPGPAPPPATSHPRVIRISHQSVEPVVMMHMNIQGELGQARAEESREQGGTAVLCGKGTREVLWPWVCVMGTQPSVAVGTGQGFGGMKGGWNKRKKPGLGPTGSHCSVFFAQILEHSLVVCRVLPPVHWDLLVMDRPWVRTRLSCRLSAPGRKRGMAEWVG